MIDADLLRRLLQLARRHCWRAVQTFRPVLLILTRGKRMLVAVLKAEKGRLTDLQDQWLGSFADAGAEVYEWRPADMDVIERILTEKPK